MVVILLKLTNYYEGIKKKMHKTFRATAPFKHTQTSRISTWTSTMGTINNKKRFMPQSMLGASTKLPACIAAWINYASECSYKFLYLLLFGCCFGCDFSVDCFVMFRVVLIVLFLYFFYHFWLSPVLRFICWLLCLCVFEFSHSSIHLIVHCMLRTVSQRLIAVVSVVQLKCNNIWHI